ncbi:InlB B-repeat-containing protein [Culicoidibacter larvae]|uniref:LPXTG cell wall anchor domain-containing protein n=1 Tax=Culicoidibacter larvae TaxID=2579976 RepID=A0A5R8Q8E8_9FIRM|nr:InlB B-repeat-containing protein [Culicoidibacter larvae]TLG71771.1 LPXTG cell wall anchor domain-containing protein [Culicoidibacter larvae]
MSKKIIAKIGAASLLAAIVAAQVSPVVSAFSEVESSGNNASEVVTSAENSTVESEANQGIDLQESGANNVASEDNVQLLASRVPLKAVLPGASVTVETVVDLVDTVNNAEMNKTITLGSSFPTALSGVITLNITHNYNITINGNNKVLTPAANQKHFNVTSTGSGTITFDSIQFKGLTSNGADGLPVAANLGGGVMIKNNQGAFVFNKTKFLNINGGGINLKGAGTLTVTNSTFDSNIVTDGGGAIRAEEAPKYLSISNSTFKNNVNNGAGYDGGAIFIKNASGVINIEHSLFLNNINKFNRGGAISINLSTASNINTINDCYFDGNKALSPAANVNADGGAISLYELGVGGKFTLTGSTFTNNVADDDGGALLLQGKENTDIQVINSTFYNNSAYGKGNAADYSGGAIQAYASGSQGSTTIATFIDNTFANNNAYSGFSASQTQRGGAVAGSGSLFRTQKAIFQNNITIGNKVYNNDGTENVNSKYKNVSMTQPTNNGGNIGFDNGADITATFEDVFGVYPVVPILHNSTVMAGDMNDSSYQAIPTMPIIPNDGITGIANGTGTPSIYTFDECAHQRSTTKPDSGAVEIGWIRYEANGGEWTLPQLTGYSGEAYYVGTNPTTYFDVGDYNGTTTIIDDSNLANGSKTFVEWNTKADGTGTTYTVGNADLTSDGLTLYAIWAEPITYTVTYDGNGHTIGSVPVDANSYSIGVTATVLNIIDLARNNHSFVGWNTAANGSGTAYAAGDAITVNGNIVLYAQWLQDETPTDNNSSTNNSSNNNSDSGLPQTGTHLAEVAVIGLVVAGASMLVLRKVKK